jgi:uncharacterized membrane protein
MLKGETMQYHDESYMGNQDYRTDRYSTARQRYNNTLVPVHDHSLQNKVNIALAVGAVAVAAGLAYVLVKSRNKQTYTRDNDDVVRTSITIMKSPEELYRYWRKLENLPRIMSHLETVTETDSIHSHWVAKAPVLGAKASWDAQITEDIPNEKIAWRSLPGSEVPNEGSAEFIELDGTRGTLLRVNISYMPPGGPLGAVAAKILGDTPDEVIKSDLRKFRQVMETGEVTTAQTSSNSAS